MILWKAYLLAWIAIRTSHLSDKLLVLPSFANVAYLVLGLVGFIPLVGFILDRPLLRSMVWRVWLLFALCWAAFDLVYFAEWFAKHPLWVQILGTSLAIPSYAAVYVYSRPSNRAWAVRAAV